MTSGLPQSKHSKQEEMGADMLLNWHSGHFNDSFWPNNHRKKPRFKERESKLHLSNAESEKEAPAIISFTDNLTCTLTNEILPVWLDN